MRGRIDGLDNPYPLAASLPGVYQDDGFTVRFVSSFDDAIAPVLMTLDNLDAYLDPHLCPPDFLAWLAGWVDLELDANWSLEQQRRLVATAVEHARWHGTIRSIVELVCRYTGLGSDAVEVTDSGGVAWSSTPNASAPGTAEATLTVTVRAPDPDAIDVVRIERLVASAKPAHVAPRIEVVAA